MSSCTSSIFRIRLVSLPVLLAGTLACHAAPAAAAPRMSESDVAALVLLANSAEVSYAQIVASRTARPDVQALAQRMATDHASLNVTFGDLIVRLDITPSDAPDAVSFRDRSLARGELLRGAAAASVDSTYAQLEVDSHTELLQLIDQRLLPSARRAELREYLAAFRPAVRAHLAHAEQVKATLAAR